MNTLQIKIIATVFLILSAANSQAQQNKIKGEKKYQKEVTKLIKKKNIQRAFQVVDELEPQTMDELILLTETPAPPFKEITRAKKFKSLLETAGADSVWIDKVGNVIALRKGADGKKVVVLDAHLDTVFPEETDVTVKRVGDTLYAPGIGDDTRGLAMISTILKAVNKAKIKTKADILFIGTVGEEGLGDLRGVKHLFDKNELGIDSWISIDGGKIGRVNNAGLGSKRYKAVFKGKGGHSWGAFGLANPHHALGKAIDHFTKKASAYTASGPKTSFNIGRIGGGTSVNSIPFESWMEVDMRSVDVGRLNTIDSLFKISMKEATEAYNNSGVKDVINLELVKIGDRPSGELAETTPLVQRAIAVTNSFNVNPRLTRGSTNGNIPISLGIPAVTIGRGGKGGNAHSLGEWWTNENGADAIKLALLLVLAEANLTK